jgi:hypothetical protein
MEVSPGLESAVMAPQAKPPTAWVVHSLAMRTEPSRVGPVFVAGVMSPREGVTTA